MHFSRISLSLVAATLSFGTIRSAQSGEPLPDLLIGYTEFRTDQPGGRYPNEWTMRSVIVKADGTGRRVLAEELTREKGSWTQFIGWSPDGKSARLSRSWMSEENGKWEEAHMDFRRTGDGFRTDAYLVDIASGKATKQMPVDDKNKSALLKSLVHGRSISPDGKRCAFEDRAYRLFLADADGSNAKQIQTGLRFHLMPSWSPDGAWILFVAGEHYDCHPHVIKSDGTGLKKLASRNGYRGVIDYLDVYDFHDGSSDLPMWAPDSKSVFYTSKVGSNVELFRVPLDDKPERLTDTPAGSMHYHPSASPDGKWLLYGSKRDGVRQLYVMRLSDRKEWRITDLKKGYAAMWSHWQPAVVSGDAPKPVKVFILAGQSNMEGQAVVDLDGKNYNDGKGTLKVLMNDPKKAPFFKHLKNDKGEWTVRDDVWVRYQREKQPLLAGPLSIGFSIYGGKHHFGPELQFGHVVGDHVRSQVLLIKTAWGGKSLYKDFRPPSSGGEVGPYYKKMLAEVRLALDNLKTDFPAYRGQGYELAGFVWYQGWNDGVDPKNAVPQYEQNLVNLIKDVRKDLNAPNLPVVIGELTGPWVDAPGAWATLRKAQASAPERPEFKGNVFFVETRQFVRPAKESPNPGHGHHEFGNAETYFLVGDALGKGMVRLLTPAVK